GKRCGMGRDGGRARGRPRRWIRRRPPRWEISGRPRVRGPPLRWPTVPPRSEGVRLPLLLRSLLRVRPVRRVLRPVCTLVRPSILLLGRSVGLRDLVPPIVRHGGRRSPVAEAYAADQLLRARDQPRGHAERTEAEPEKFRH